MKIAFTTDLPQEGFKCLAGHELNASLEEAEVLVSTFDFPVPRKMIEAMPHLRLIANFGAGFNNIDIEVCRERGIRVTNTPQPVIEPTAELAFALMIDIARRVSEFDRLVRDGKAQFGVMRNLSHSLYGKTLGIIGMGRIGQALARRAQAAGMHIIYHNRHRLPDETEQKYGATYVDFQRVLQDSDFLSLGDYINATNKDGKASVSDMADSLLYKVPGTDLSVILNQVAVSQAVEKYADNIMALLNELRNRFDFVVVDTAPLKLVSDAEELAPMTDTCIIVVRQHWVEAREINDTIDALGGKEHMLGSVFNNARKTGMSASYGSYGYGGHYAK